MNEEIKILRLNLSRKWFNMIKSGEKKEEYRELKEFWLIRLLDIKWPKETKYDDKYIPSDIVFDLKRHSWVKVFKSYRAEFKTFDIVEFRNGYSKNASSFQIEFKGIDIGEPKPEWTDENWQGEVFRIKLGEIVRF